MHGRSFIANNNATDLHCIVGTYAFIFKYCFYFSLCVMTCTLKHFVSWGTMAESVIYSSSHRNRVESTQTVPEPCQIRGKVFACNPCLSEHGSYEEPTPWSRVVLEKLIGFQLTKKFPSFYGTGKFITTFTSARLTEYTYDNMCTVVNNFLSLCSVY